MNEETLKNKLESKLSKDFFIEKEVSGSHPIYNIPVRIDYLLKAKPHLIESGFTTEWFGVECKWTGGIEGQTSKVSRLFWQSITYAQSQFKNKEEVITPKFVAVLVSENLHPIIQSHFKAQSQLALYGNVGELFFYKDGNWGIKFTYLYARSFENEYSINETKLPKIRAGSI
jgi:hypothetical protein